jgi:hypothetical protein
MTFTPTVLFDAYISINSNVVSDHGNKVQLNFDWEDLDATTFGQTAKVRRGGLQDGTVDISFLNDFVAANLDSIFFPLGGTVVPYEIRPTSSARSTGNPAYIGNLFIKSWKPIGGDVGKLVQVDVSFPTSGLNTRVTA